MLGRTFFLTLITLIAFAANSVLNRMALKDELIDPALFTEIRLASGALFLLPIFWIKRSAVFPLKPIHAVSAVMLFVYAACFSFAYVSLGAATGALILFGCVQFTMIGYAIYRGEFPNPLQWLGITIACLGLIWLLFPGLSAPNLFGTGLMIVAGLAWGAYSLLGGGADDPVAATARNFVLSLPLVALLLVSMMALSSSTYWTSEGVLLALASGVFASGAGYVIWYQALKGLTKTSASIVQLLVPGLAAIGGVFFLSEPLSLRLILALLLILGGIYLTIHFKTVKK